ncbi:MAG: dihydrofolate reductase, partial [Treponemataceae bacterium]|nr:dihydrofolate reductase [Treponemataceae bacterium]
MSRAASIAIIAAYTKAGRVLGKDGRIPWSIPGERSRFRILTTGGAVVMGRRTYEEIGRPLPDRLNIVLSRTARFSADGCVTARSLAAARAAASAAGCPALFVCGGAGLY